MAKAEKLPYIKKGRKQFFLEECILPLNTLEIEKNNLNEGIMQDRVVLSLFDKIVTSNASEDSC